jgi:putative tricarboxylic transport membrane protein
MSGQTVAVPGHPVQPHPVAAETAAPLSPRLADEERGESARVDAIPLAPALAPNGEGEPLTTTLVPAATSATAARFPLPLTISNRHGGIAVALLLALGGALTVWQSSLLDIGNVDLPGPGFFPLALGALLAVLATGVAVDCWRAPEGERIALGHRDVLVVIVALFLVPLAFEPLGALPTLGLFGAALLALVARVPIVLAVLAAALGMAGCWYFFQVLLGLQLPAGPLL